MTLSVAQIAKLQDFDEYKELHWEGSFQDYLAVVRERPFVVRSAYQRVYDMIESYGREEYIDSRKKIVHYPFFDDEVHGGRTPSSASTSR
jgi:serine protein kinase